MTLKEHYKFHSRKSIKPYMVLVLLILLTITIFHTFGGYSSAGNGAGTTQAAKWLLNINEEPIFSNTTTLSSEMQLINSSDGTNKIDIEDEFYFDITINPATTEVAITYAISIDLNNASSSLPSGTKIIKYEKYNITDVANPSLISETQVNNTSVVITDNINLSTTQTPLSNADAVKYRAYCQMPAYADMVRDAKISVVPQITVQQILGNE